MEVTDVESFAISIPLEEPVSFSTHTIEERDHAIVYIETDEGPIGLGYTLGYRGAELIADAVTDLLAPIIEGEDPHDTERLWREMFDSTVQIGRRGVLLRAISIVDIALWDAVAKAAEQPLNKYLGAYTDELPAYASGGYYRDDKGTEGLREELQTYVDRGHDIVKMKVGRASAPREEERVRAARETIGPDRQLLLDANGAWTNKQEAMENCRRFAPANPYFIEEPVLPDRMELMGEVNEALDYAVATGELHFTRYDFVNLLRENAVEVVQPDVTVVGGVTEWLKVANLAANHDIPVAPHYNWDLHAHLLSTIENGLWLEYFYRDWDVKVFDDVLEYPMDPEDGMIAVPDRPGHGVVLDQSAVDEYRI